MLLVQFRLHDAAERQEAHCFRTAAALAGDELVSVNVAREPVLRWPDVSAYDAVLLGGAGEYSVTDRHPFSPWVEEVVDRLIEEGRPVLGSCYGHHVLAQVTGGEVITDPQTEEVGTFDVTLTEAGLADPVLEGLPATFAVQLGHHDRVSRAGSGLVELARSERCPWQILKIEGKPVYGTQFHAEMDFEHMVDRLAMYRESYVGDSDALDAIGDVLAPAPLARRVLRRFLEIFV
ncbi:MAG: gamma-glutamyl-gamma-aminobutyrate hydrolase family protein [Thermoanaerobaculia bacterium]